MASSFALIAIIASLGNQQCAAVRKLINSPSMTTTPTAPVIDVVNSPSMTTTPTAPVIDVVNSTSMTPTPTVPVYNVQEHECANNDVDVFRKDDKWCYIRMYKCSDENRWSLVRLRGLWNSNTGDLAWGAGGKALGTMTCGTYGKYLEIWRVKVKRELLNKHVDKYTQCNKNACGCGLQGECNNGHEAAVDFGWRYKDKKGKSELDSKRQFSLPRKSEWKQWKTLCLERAVDYECIKKTTYGETNMTSVATIFKRDVLDNPVSECKPLTHVNKCPWWS